MRKFQRLIAQNALSYERFNKVLRRFKILINILNPKLLNGNLIYINVLRGSGNRFVQLKVLHPLYNWIAAYLSLWSEAFV